MRRPLTILMAACAPLLTVAACGGGDGDGGGVPGAVSPPPVLAPTPTPTPSPAPTPTPISAPTPSTALIAPSSTASPVQPVAAVGGTSFSAPGSGAQLPLLITAASGAFGGDAATTQEGGVLGLAADGTVRVTLNNAALGVTNVALTGPQEIANGRVFLGYEPRVGSSSRSFSWLISRGPIANAEYVAGGVAMAGFVTPRSAVPSNGSVTFAGRVSGVVSEFHIVAGAGYAALVGNAVVEANFAANTLSGTLSGLGVGSDEFYVTGPINQLTFVATFDAARNAYVGRIVAGASPGGPNAFPAGASGTIVLQLLGPDAREAAGVFTLSDGIVRLLGTTSTSR